METTIDLQDVLTSVKSNQFLQMIMNAASLEQEGSAFTTTQAQKEYLNYPYTRATEHMGASMATSGRLIKEQSPKKFAAKSNVITSFNKRFI